MDFCKAMIRKAFDAISMVNDSTFNNTITDSCQLLDATIEDATTNKETLDSTMDSVIKLMKEVECNEKAAEQAKEEASNSSLDIFVKVDELKQAQQHAKEINEMYAKKVYTHKAVLATEMEELQLHASGVLDKGDKSLGVLHEMRKALETRLTSALREKELAEKQKVEKEISARKALAHEESQIKNVVEESERLKQEAIKNSELQKFLADRGHIADILDREISDKCKDVKVLKESIDQAVLSMKKVELNETPKECADEDIQFVNKEQIIQKAVMVFSAKSNAEGVALQSTFRKKNRRITSKKFHRLPNK